MRYYERCPQITLSPEERARYDHAARTYLLDTVVEAASFDPQRIDPSVYEFVVGRKDMSMYHRVESTPDPPELFVIGTGLVDGSLDDVMSGQYQDTTEDKVITDAVLGYPFAGGGVLSVTDRRTVEDPFRFGGIKWIACTSVHGLLKDRDFLLYERMGKTVDSKGNPVAYVTLQSIRRPEFPMEAIPGMQRQHAATCFLFRPRPDLNKTEVFIRGFVYQFGKYPRTVIYYGAARTWISLVTVVKAGYAKKFSALIDQADAHGWEPSSKSCHVCSREPLLRNLSTCAGCHQSACRSCSHHRVIFALDAKRKKPLKRLFCVLCIKSVTGRARWESDGSAQDSDDDSVSTQSISTGPESNSSIVGERGSSESHNQQYSARADQFRTRSGSRLAKSLAVWGSAGPMVPGASLVLDW